MILLLLVRAGPDVLTALRALACRVVPYRMHQFVPFQLLLAANVMMVGVAISQTVYAVSQGVFNLDWDFSVEAPLTCQIFGVLMIVCLVGNVAGITTVWVFVYRLLSRTSELEFGEDAAVFKVRTTLFGLLVAAAWSSMLFLDEGYGQLGGIVCFVEPTRANAVVSAFVVICVADVADFPRSIASRRHLHS